MSKNAYNYKISVFCSRNDIKSKQNDKDINNLCKYLSENNITLVNGAGHTGNMLKTTKAMHKYGGQTIGIGLHRFEPQPHSLLTEWEAYETHSERQSRIIELGDIYVALTGGLGTLHEIIDVHILQLLGEVNHPLILIGEHNANYKKLLDFFRQADLLHKIPSNIIYAKDSKEAIMEIEKYFNKLQAENYYNKIYYPALSAEDIYKHIKLNQRSHYVLFNGLKMKVNPNVYPSNRFRSSKILAEYVRKVSKGKKIADIACGHGTMGLVAADAGAKHVVQVDINPAAVENAKDNRKLLNFEDKIDIYEGDVFEPLSYRYKNYFDIIFFNPPFHKNTKFKNDKLMYAFYTQGNQGGVIEKFLKRAHFYLNKKGVIILGFSNKDSEALNFLEETMEGLGYEYKIHLIKNQDSHADNRIYSIKYKGETKKEKIKTLNICALISESGLSSSDGQQMKNGIEIALKELKLEGFKIKMGLLDDKGSNLETIKQTVKAIEKFKPDGLIGPTWSYLIENVSPILEESKLPYFTPATSTEMINNPTQFMLSGSQNIETKEDHMVFWLKKNFIQNFVYLFRKNKWADLHINLYEKICKELNIKFQAIHIEKDAEMKSEIKKIKKLSNLAINIDNYEDNIFEILTEIKKQKIHSPILLNLNLSKNLETEIKKSKFQNQILEIQAPIPSEFVEKHEHMFPDQKVTRYAFNAYAGMHILAHGLHQTTKENLRHFLIEGLPMVISGETFCYKQNGDLRQSNWEIKQI